MVTMTYTGIEKNHKKDIHSRVLLKRQSKHNPSAQSPLLWVELSSLKKICWSPNSPHPRVNVTLFGNNILADVIKLRWGHTGLGWPLNPVTGVLVRMPCEDIETHREKMAVSGRRQRLKLCCHKPRNTNECWQPPETRKNSSLEPLAGVWPCGHLDFGGLASKTVTEYISVVLSHPVCGTSWR